MMASNPLHAVDFVNTRHIAWMRIGVRIALNGIATIGMLVLAVSADHSH